MPYQIVKHGKLYSVVNTQTGKIHSFGTSRNKAEKQMKLLYMIEKMNG